MKGNFNGCLKDISLGNIFRKLLWGKKKKAINCFDSFLYFP